jgi:hypothetical protein
VKNNLVVYKANFGDYDQVSDVKSDDWGCDYVCFTDNPKFSAKGWSVILVPLNDQTPSTLNRHYKMLPHRYFNGYDYSLYLDGNIDLVSNPRPLIQEYLAKKSIASPIHPKRSCSYEEAIHCVRSGLSSEQLIKKQMDKYLRDGFPYQAGLTENGVMLRRHNDIGTIELMEDWWREYCAKVKRDQISLHYLAWKHQIEIAFMQEGPRVSKKYFHIGLHKSDSKLSLIRRFARYSHGNQYRSWYYRSITILFGLAYSLRSILRSNNCLARFLRLKKSVKNSVKN